jgi:hypothetical protein
MLRELSGRWIGIGTLGAGRGVPGQRVECSFEIGWLDGAGRLEQRLDCRGASSSFKIRGTLTALSGHQVLSGHVTMTNLPVGAFAHGEFRGRALYTTIVARGTDREDALLVAPDTSFWILVLNRGERRLSSVIRKPRRSGVADEILRLSLVKQSALARAQVEAAEGRGPDDVLDHSPAVPPRDFDQPPISR